jgi:hypothetical protein
MNILDLLKRVEWAGYDGCGSVCPECSNSHPYIDHLGENQGGYHSDDCQLKATIDALEAGRLVVVDMDQPVYNPDLLATIKMIEDNLKRGKNG